MAEENEAAPAAGGDQPAAAPLAPKMNVVNQFIRDMSFENIASQKGITIESQPAINVQVGLNAGKRDAENQYDVIMKVNIDAKDASGDQQFFLLELEYAGVFSVENVAKEQLHPFLLIECPRMLFPYVRRIVGDITRDGGFPPLNLETIDFVALYRNEITRRAQAEAQKSTIS